MLPLDIVSDPICPWCYIGKARLDQAVKQVGFDPFIRRWRIFQLNPDMPAEGMDRGQYLKLKFGEEDGGRMYDAVLQEARTSGLTINLDAIQRTPNTMDAHRLIRWSETTGNQNAVVEQLFHRYFVNGDDISDREVLISVATSAGMERDIVAALLDSEADRKALVEEEAEARQMGIRGVPCFIVDSRYVLQGAQDVETWVHAIEEVREKLSEAGLEIGPGVAS